MKDLIIAKFLKSCSEMREEIKAIYLFGSRARGEERPDSDYDLLIVTDTYNKKFRQSIYEAVIDILLDTGKLISLKILKREDFLRFSQMGLPFIENVLKEGIKIG